MGSRAAAICFVLLLAAALPGRSSAGEPPQWTGSLRSLNLASEATALAPELHLSSTRLRLETTATLSSGWQSEAAADLQLLGSDPAGVVALPREGVNRRLDLDQRWQEGHAWGARLQIDRLNLNWRNERVDLVLGRQAIGFGRIVIVSPLDIIAPFPPDALDTDIRPGVDAARLTAHYGLDGQFGAVTVFGDEPRHNSYLATWSDNRAGLDLLALAGSLRSRPMAGLGLAGSLGTLGLKGEISVYRGQRVGDPEGDLHEHMTMSALEAWYHFADGLTLIAQYLHNGAGVGDPLDYPRAARSAPLLEGLSSLLGRNYLLAAPSYELHPLVTLNGLLMLNLDDDSWLARPSLAINLADNLSLELFWSATGGARPRRPAAFLPPLPRSEFGSQGDNGGFFFKYFF